VRLKYSPRPAIVSFASTWAAEYRRTRIPPVHAAAATVAASAVRLMSTSVTLLSMRRQRHLGKLRAVIVNH
jgi:hypothetical protein